MDERVGGGDREEFEGGAAAGAGFSQIGDDGDGEEGGGGGLAGGEGAVGIRRDAGSGGIDIRGGVGRGHGGGRWRREDDEGVGGGGSGEGRRVRPGLLSFKDRSGRVRTRFGNGDLFDPFLFGESEGLQGNGAVAAKKLLAFAEPVPVE